MITQSISSLNVLLEKFLSGLVNAHIQFTTHQAALMFASIHPGGDSGDYVHKYIDQWMKEFASKTHRYVSESVWTPT